MKKKSIIFFIFSIPLILFAQENTQQKKQVSNTYIPIQSQYSEKFTIKNANFTKKIDVNGQGEILEVDLELINLTDDPMDLYIFVIATFEKKQLTKSSFERPIPERETVRNFVPYPYDLKNFQYPDTDDNGNVKKNDENTDAIKFKKFPHDPKAGIDITTGKPYYLNEKLLVRTQHLSKYRKNYFYFNEITVLVFNKDGAPQYQKKYQLTGSRH